MRHASARPRRRLTAAAAMMTAALGWPGTAAGQAVDMQLILAVDCSFSVDADEYRQQVDGLAAAFRAPEVMKAIARGPRGAIAVSVVQWAGSSNQSVTLPWTRLAHMGDALRVAARLDTMQRVTAEGVTSVSGVMQHALGHFDRGPYRGDRRVLDISSDGRHNEGRPLPAIRQMLSLRNIQVNALAILNEHPTLDYYYRQRVITGPSAFVVKADSYAAYRRAIREKLIREISHVVVAEAAAHAEARHP